MDLKPTVIHVIDSFIRGGAETLLVNLLPELNQHYNLIIVTLNRDNDFGEEKIFCKARYCLDFTGSKSILSCAFRLKKIIKAHKPHLVRSQLYMSSLIARLATPRKVPMVFSIHNPMSLDSYKKNRFALPVEKLTYRERHHLISVSKDALNDFNQYVGIKGPSYTLYNFINQLYVERAQVKTSITNNPLKLVAVGTLKEQKNYGYLIDAFKKLKHEPISLDIYGEGSLRKSLQSEIDQHGLNIQLKGNCRDVYNILPDYDLYVLSSKYEGFGIAPIEAMAIGLPLMLSDLSVLREVTHNNALFFDPTDSDSFVRLILGIKEGKHDLTDLSAKGINIARENYQQKYYFKMLDHIYRQVISSQNNF